jgi:hypothetical protein
VYAGLKPLKEKVVKVTFRRTERAAYSKLEARVKDLFALWHDAGIVRNSTIKVLAWMTKLRQMCSYKHEEYVNLNLMDKQLCEQIEAAGGSVGVTLRERDAYRAVDAIAGGNGTVCVCVCMCVFRYACL